MPLVYWTTYDGPRRPPERRPKTEAGEAWLAAVIALMAPEEREEATGPLEWMADDFSARGLSTEDGVKAWRMARDMPPPTKFIPR